jgi:hypothetical protein
VPEVRSASGKGHRLQPRDVPLGQAFTAGSGARQASRTRGPSDRGATSAGPWKEKWTRDRDSKRKHERCTTTSTTALTPPSFCMFFLLASAYCPGAIEGQQAQSTVLHALLQAPWRCAPNLYACWHVVPMRTGTASTSTNVSCTKCDPLFLSACCCHHGCPMPRSDQQKFASATYWRCASLLRVAVSGCPVRSRTASASTEATSTTTCAVVLHVAFNVAITGTACATTCAPLCLHVAVSGVPMPNRER